MSDASIKTILGQLKGISRQVKQLDDHVAESDKANAERLDRAVLLLRESAEVLERKAGAIDDLKARVSALERRGRVA